MKVYNPQDILNIAVVGHGGDGKTTLTEAMLFNSGAIERQGRVEDKNTVTDYDPEETKRMISIGLAVAPLEWKEKKINLVDVPGYFDFIGEAVAAYEMCDNALIVLSPHETVPVGAAKAYDYCVKHNIPRAFVVNQIDKENTKYSDAIKALTEKYGAAITPVQIPIMEENKFTGIIDVIGLKAYRFENGKRVEIDVPSDLADEVTIMREILTENAAGNEEKLLEKFFEGGALTQDEIFRGLEIGVESGSIAPVFVCAAAANLGVITLLDELISLLPHADAKVVCAKDKDGKELKLKADPEAPFAAHVLKTIADPFVGKISIIKVVSGTLKADATMDNFNTGKHEKCANLGIMRGKKLINIEKVCAGDICAVAKLAHTVTGDTLCNPSHPVDLGSIGFPKPCISLAVVAKKQGEEEKVYGGLHKLEEEDPTFKLTKDKETGDMLANGLGEMHLEIINKKLKHKFNVEGELHDPRIPYRETIRKAVKTQGKHKKQSGGHGQYGDVWVEFEPILDGSETFEFVDKVVGGVVPRQYIPAVEKGLRESLTKGVLAGYPMVNLKCTLYDGSYHPVDSSEMAFKMAAGQAYKKGVLEANPVLLEPICKVAVTIPDEYMGEIIGDLNRRRGKILGMNPVEEGEQVVAEVPMSEMFKYATDLRSMTQAKGSFEQEFERYEEVPAPMAAKVIEKAKKDLEEN